MANYITLIRTLLSFAVVAMLHVRTKWMYLAAFALTIILIWMDALDGYVARLRKETSKLGAVVDILGDRVVEMSYWIVFAKFGWVPLWVAILVVGARHPGRRNPRPRARARHDGVRRIDHDAVEARHAARQFAVEPSAVWWRQDAGVLAAHSRVRTGLFRHIGPIVTWLAYASVYTTVVMCVVRDFPSSPRPGTWFAVRRAVTATCAGPPFGFRPT